MITSPRFIGRLVIASTTTPWSCASRSSNRKCSRSAAVMVCRAPALFCTTSGVKSTFTSTRSAKIAARFFTTIAFFVFVCSTFTSFVFDSPPPAVLGVFSALYAEFASFTGGACSLLPHNPIADEGEACEDLRGEVSQKSRAQLHAGENELKLIF